MTEKQKLLQEVLDKLDKWWSFDRKGQHTHSQDTKSDFLDWLRKCIAEVGGDDDKREQKLREIMRDTEMLVAELYQLRAAKAKLLAALKKYGDGEKHKRCWSKCNCGLQAAIDAEEGGG